MAQISPVTLPKNTWVDLYSATGITPGTKLIIHNNSNFPAILSDSAIEPAPGYGFDRIAPDKFLSSADTPSGVWAKSTSEVVLQVEVA